MLSASAHFVPGGARERLLAPLLRLVLRFAVRPKLSPDVPIAVQRRHLKRMTRFTRRRIDVRVEPGSVGGIQGEWLRPPDAVDGATILYLHGGGYCLGSPATYRAITAHLAQATRLPVFAADYRLAPEHPRPAALDDAASACRALMEQGPVVVTGDSAGGGLALATALSLRARPPVALVLFSPWIDLANARRPRSDAVLTQRWLEACARHYLAGAAAVSALDADLTGLPPTLIQAGADELLRDDATRLHDALERAGAVVRCEIVPGRWHSFQLHAGWLPSADAAIARAADFIGSHVPQ